MNKTCLILLFSSTFLYHYLNAQAFSQKDSLNKFSYLLYGFKMASDGEIIQSQGTGFFFRSESNVYLVTAEHVVDGCINKIKDTLQPNEMFLWQYAHAPYKEWYIKLDTKLIRDTSTCSDHRLFPDIFIYKVDNVDSQKMKINYVSDYFTDLPIRNRSFSFYGFPSKNRDDNENSFDQKTSYFNSENFLVRNSPTRFGNQDIINYYVDLKDKKIDSTIRGFSGAPAFIIDKTNGKPAFLGVLSSGDLISNTFLIVKRLYLLEAIHEYESRMKI